MVLFFYELFSLSINIKYKNNIRHIILILEAYCAVLVIVNRLPIIDPKFSAINSAIGVDKKQTTDNNMTLFNRLSIIPPI